MVTMVASAHYGHIIVQQKPTQRYKPIISQLKVRKEFLKVHVNVLNSTELYTLR